MRLKKISVVIATRNRPLLLAKCLNAIVNQTYRNFEVIVINSGENITNNVWLRSLQKKQSMPSVIIVNVGKRLLASQAWNRGILLAKGPIIAFTDDDAIPNRKWLGSIATFFNLHPNIAGINGKIEAVSEKTSIEKLRQTYYNFRDFIYSHGLLDNLNKRQFGLVTNESNLCDWFSMANCAIQRKFLMNFRFDEKMRLNAGHKLGRIFLESGLIVQYLRSPITSHHHSRTFRSMFSTKALNGIYFCEIDKNTDVSVKKRLHETYYYLKYLLRDKRLNYFEKLLEAIFLLVQYLNYFYRKSLLLIAKPTNYV